MEQRLALSLQLLELCRQRGLTLGQLAQLSGVPISTLKNIVSGQSRNPGIFTLQALCRGLGVSLADLAAALEAAAENDEL